MGRNDKYQSKMELDDFVPSTHILRLITENNFSFILDLSESYT
ncbi:hypothetical protein ACWFPQ_05745 [Peribacillus butanolivorans]